jgi:hypothetical protein
LLSGFKIDFNIPHSRFFKSCNSSDLLDSASILKFLLSRYCIGGLEVVVKI